MPFFLKQKLPDSNGNPIKIYLNASEVHIGRRKKFHLQNYVHVSKKHATIYITNSGKVSIKDLNSSNGLYINGLKVDTNPQPVHVGDIIGFGNPCLEGTGTDSFICILCLESASDPELIDITDENDEHNSLCNFDNRSDLSLQTAFTCPESNCIDVDDETQHFINCNKLNESELLEISDPSSSKFCGSCSNSVNKADLAERNANILSRDNTDNTSIKFQNFLNVQREIMEKNCHVSLVRCDSEYFECPPGVQNPFNEEGLEELSNESPPLGIKRKPFKRLISDSSDSSEEIESFSLTSKKYLEDSLNNENFQNFGNNKEASYSQNEEIILISDDESYLDFYSSRHFIQIKEEPPDIEEDIDNQSDHENSIFDDSDCLSSIVRPDEDNVETIETIKEFVENGTKTIEVDVSDKLDLEMQHNEITNSSENFESLNCRFNSDESKSVKDHKVYYDLDHQCREGSDSDSNESSVLGSVTFPVGSNITGKSSHRYKTDEGRIANRSSSLNSLVRKDKGLKKSSGKTLLTEPKPMIQRSCQIRGRKEGFREQKKYHKRNQSDPVKDLKHKRSSSKLKIKSGEISFSKMKYKIPLKSKAQNNKNHTDVNTPFSLKNSSDGIHPCSIHDVNLKTPLDQTRKKVPPIKIRPNEYRTSNEPINVKRVLQKEQKQNERLNFSEKQKKNNFIRTSTLQQSLLNHNISKHKSDKIEHVSSSNAIFASNTRDSSAVINRLYRDKVKPPQHSKRSVSFSSNAQMNTSIIINKLISLEPKWLQEQVNNSLPPPQVSDGAADLPLHFELDSYVSLFAPMIMLNIWDYMYTESKIAYIGDKILNNFYFSIISCGSLNEWYELKCDSIVADKVSYSPKKGCLVVLRLKENSTLRPVFGYIFSHATHKLDPNFVQSSDWRNLPKEWLVDAKYWTFHVYIKRKEMPFLFGKLMTANGICYLRSKLRLADVLGNIKMSPLIKDILLPTPGTFFVYYGLAAHAREYSTHQIQLIGGMNAEIEKQNSESKIILVNGPPGTGKTHTIIGLLERLILYSKSALKILVVAPSNSAIDEIGCRLIELNEQSAWRGGKLNFVRVGMEKQVHNRMIPYLLENQVNELHKKRLLKLSDMQKEISRFDKIVPNYLPKEVLNLERYEYNDLKKKNYN